MQRPACCLLRGAKSPHAHQGDRERSEPVQLPAKDTLDVRQAVDAVYSRNRALSSRITAFLDVMARRLQDG